MQKTPLYEIFQSDGNVSDPNAQITHVIIYSDPSNIHVMHNKSFSFSSCSSSLLFSESSVSSVITLPHNQACECDCGENSNHARARHGSRTARFSAAARAVVGDVVPLGGDFEDGAWAWVAAVVVVDEEEVGRGAVVACARYS